MRALLLIVVPLLALMPTSVLATPAEDALAAFLHKKYNKSGGLLGAIIPNTPTGYAADHEGRKDDGSYWSSAYFNALNVSTAGGPQRSLAKHCEKAMRLLLDGGAGDDWVFALGGTGAITVGGAGSDFLYNSSYKGLLWGDGLDGRGASNTGSGTDDTFWWSAGSFIMDAGKNDRLQLFGLPMVGGSNALYYGVGLERAVARDFLLPWVTYGVTESGQLLVEASFGEQLNPAMGEDAILEVAMVVENWDPGDLGIEFIVKGGGDEMSLFKSLFKLLGAQAGARSSNSTSINVNYSGASGRCRADMLEAANDNGMILRGVA